MASRHASTVAPRGSRGESTAPPRGPVDTPPSGFAPGAVGEVQGTERHHGNHRGIHPAFGARARGVHVAGRRGRVREHLRRRCPGVRGGVEGARRRPCGGRGGLHAPAHCQHAHERGPPSPAASLEPGVCPVPGVRGQDGRARPPDRLPALGGRRRRDGRPRRGLDRRARRGQSSAGVCRWRSSPRRR